MARDYLAEILCPALSKASEVALLLVSAAQCSSEVYWLLRSWRCGCEVQLIVVVAMVAALESQLACRLSYLERQKLKCALALCHTEEKIGQN